MDWAEEYRPHHLSELVGNREAIRQIADWARNWKVGKPPLLIYGKPGIGKTSSAYALAEDMHWEIVELNASDQRTKAVIERIAGTSASTGSLTGAARKLIILDEADNLQGNADRGGARAIVEVIRQARQPIILIANDLYGLDGGIRNLCEKVQFRAVQARSILPRLKEICSREGVSCDNLALTEIAENAGGDIRAAVTILYASTLGREALSTGGISASHKDPRASIFDLITSLMGSGRNLSMEVNETPDVIIQWIEANVHLLSGADAVINAYTALSRADEFLGYTYKNQYYTLWRYAGAMMRNGVHAAAKGSGIHGRIMPPDRWKRMSTAKKQKMARNQLFARIGTDMQMAASTVRNEYLCLLSLLAEQDPARYARALSLDADQMNVLIQDPETTKKVMKEIDDERKMQEKELKKQLKKEADLKKKAEGKATKPISKPEKPEEIAPLPEAEKSAEKPKEKTQSTLFSFGD